MTKETALEIIDMDTYKCATYCEDVVATYNVQGLIDTIYDDIESQVCENCEYLTTNFIPNHKTCRLGIGILDKDFGCNHFKEGI